MLRKGEKKFWVSIELRKSKAPLEIKFFECHHWVGGRWREIFFQILLLAFISKNKRRKLPHEFNVIKMKSLRKASIIS